MISYTHSEGKADFIRKGAIWHDKKDSILAQGGLRQAEQAVQMFLRDLSVL